MVSFKGDEEKLIDSVISVLDAGREKFTFQEMNIISELQHKGIIINLERREVIRNGKKVGMTYTEFEILQLLAKNPGRVLSKEQIYDVVWKESYSGDYNIVMSHISHIREKIEDDPVHNTRLFNQSIQTVCLSEALMLSITSLIRIFVITMQNGIVLTCRVSSLWATLM